MIIDRLPDELLEHIFVLAGELPPCDARVDATPTVRRLYLDRSRRRLLDVEIIITMQNGANLSGRPVSQTALRTLVTTIIQELPRWRQIHVSTPFPDLLDVVMSLLGQENLSAPSLEIMAIECPFEAGLLNNESLPRLRSFDVASAPWTLSDLHVLSNAAPQLTHLAVTSSYKLDSHVSLHFPALRSLRIGDYFQNATILELLEAPQLEVLQIEDMEVQFNVTAGWYVDALRDDGSNGDQGKFPNLRSLRLQMPGSPEDPSPLIVGQRFSEFLRLFPSIEHLAFVGLHVHQFVRGLAALHSHVEPDDVLLPRLTHLTLGGQSEPTTLDGEHGVRFFKSVMHLVKVRRKADAPLRKVQVPAKVLARDRFLPQKLFMLLRSGQRKDVEIEGLHMPYPSDVWLGYKWGLRVLQSCTARPLPSRRRLELPDDLSKVSCRYPTLNNVIHYRSTVPRRDSWL
ncbi:uncharacterized protein B0H18DRAFT_867915 [Fomitopsis serialis]|uniref:uncharacterized protein n=1 Tax=Fomitopsis serialis TaxID=139415 RepID=UPI002007F7CE|nr:uncharacterized protein B0H18DRAFT_867915 [Neoantrodia serialis]KAH9936414.1 hypothetical protein B0H18DRAFT_867915 [Neoantrodia serialis]